MKNALQTAGHGGGNAGQPCGTAQDTDYPCIYNYILIRSTIYSFKLKKSMKLKLNRFFFGALSVALTLASCSNKEIPGVENGDDLIAGLPTMARIAVSQSGTGNTRAGGTETATDAEKTLGAVTVYVFSEGTLTDIQTIASGQNSVTFNTTTGRKQLFAVGNIPAERLAGVKVENNMSLQEVKKQILDVASIADLATDNAFWITNFNEAPVVTVRAASQADAGTTNNFTINIGRACAKVNLALDAHAVQNGGTLTDIKYRVRNNPKRMYLLPTFLPGNDQQLITPYYDFAWNTTGADTGTGAMGTTVDAGSYFGNGDATPPTFTNVNTPEYMMENSNATVLRGKATYLSITGKWVPNTDQLKNADGTPATALTEADGSFWRIAQVENKGQANEKIIAWEDGIFIATPTVSNADDTSHKTVKFTGGICYYGMWIADNTQNISSRKYSVWRNRYYKVNITDVKGPGVNTEDGVVPDPTDPVEQDAYMQATIQVNDWIVIDQSGGI